MTRPVTISSDLAQLANLVAGNCTGLAQVSGISHDSRIVQPGDLYVALPGSNTHGIEFIDQAMRNGALAIATDSYGSVLARDRAIPTIEMLDARKNMATLAAQIYGHPESKLSLTGVTGTNGKTTTTHMLRSMFLDASKRVGVVGTLGTYVDEEYLPGARTTPESTDLYATLALMVERGITHVFMEVSSHALALHRVEGLKFDVSIFTNLTQDHLDFHGSMENYFNAKALLFTPEFSRQAIICIDDDWGVKLATQVQIPALTIGVNGAWKTSPADLTSQNSTTQQILVADADSMTLEVNMLGSYNAMNAACALAASQILGNSISQGLASLKNVRPIPGRLEHVVIASPGTVIVDYAHTPDAVTTVLTVLKDSNPTRVITVIGCGGERDASKRPLMGRVAAQISDVVIVTDDNPRTEDASAIRKSIIDGTKNCPATVLEIADRRQAISKALSLAQAGDVIAVLGKGHETGQESNGQIIAFDDRLVVRQESQNV